MTPVGARRASLPPITDPEIRRRAGELSCRPWPEKVEPLEVRRGDRWASWALKAAALGSPLPEVPSWALRDPRLADYEWAVIAALAERLGEGDVVGFVEVTLAQIARQIIDPHPGRAEVAALELAVEHLARLGLVSRGRTTFVLRPQVIPPASRPEPAPCSDDSFQEYGDSLPENERATYFATWARCLENLRSASGDASTKASTRSSTEPREGACDAPERPREGVEAETAPLSSSADASTDPSTQASTEASTPASAQSRGSCSRALTFS